MHLPLELVAEAAGVSRVTAWRHLPALRELGLVDWRTHKAAYRGETRNSGSVWRVRLSPLRGSRARVSADDLRHKWRGAEMRGADSYRMLKRTKDFKSYQLKVEGLISWALSPGTSSAPVVPVRFTTSRGGLEALLDVTGAPREKRGAAVDAAAHALAQALRDASSLNFYRRLLWQLLRRVGAGGEDCSYAVYLAAVRARVDAQEGFARKPGALFLSRLKCASWYAEMMDAPPTRVGSKPLEA